MRNYFTLDGTASTSFGLYLSGSGTFSAPEKVTEYIEVPGRNGDLLTLDDSFRNIEVTYPCFIYSSFDSNLASLRAFLLSRNGYVKLTDTYHTSEYRMASFKGPLDPDVVSRNDAGSFDIVFNCKPQRFLTSGDTTVTYTANGTISNPTRFTSQPLLRIYGVGAAQIGSVTVTISSASSYTDIDCQMMDCYKGSTNRNAYVSFSGNDFPTLAPGSNGVTLGTGITKIEVTPRWWTV